MGRYFLHRRKEEERKRFPQQTRFRSRLPKSEVCLGVAFPSSRVEG
uniref:Uncharacterized protein n=1 Tax=Cucumis melo TaxID=3656 RepID=A0A9I9E163_CUCME